MKREIIQSTRPFRPSGFTALESVIVLGVIGIISWVLIALWQHEDTTDESSTSPEPYSPSRIRPEEPSIEEPSIGEPRQPTDGPDPTTEEPKAGSPAIEGPQLENLEEELSLPEPLPAAPGEMPETE